MPGVLKTREAFGLRRVRRRFPLERESIRSGDVLVQLADVALKLRNLFIDRQMTAISQQINHPETDDATRDNLLRQQQELRLLKRQPLSAAV